MEDTDYSWEYVRDNVLPLSPQTLTINQITSKTSGPLQIRIGSTKIESVLIPSKIKKLYVFPSGFNNEHMRYPDFTRISWCQVFDGVKLYFDDPTRIEKNFSPSYFWGNEKENYIDYLRKIVKKVARKNKIKNKNIVFLGSSCCGFISLYLANEFSGSKCIALCPQVDVKTLCGEKFSRAMGISIDNPKYKKRLNVLRVLKNKKSSFFIYSNLLCPQDEQQMKLLYKKAGKPFVLGLTQLSKNIKCLLAEVPFEKPHHAQPNEYFCSTIEKLMDVPIDQNVITVCNLFIEEMKKYFAHQNKEYTQRTLKLRDQSTFKHFTKPSKWFSVVRTPDKMVYRFLGLKLIRHHTTK